MIKENLSIDAPWDVFSLIVQYSHASMRNATQKFVAVPSPGNEWGGDRKLFIVVHL